MRSVDEMRTELTQQIIETIKAGTPPWRQPWGDTGPLGLPCNFHSGRRYSGINTISLMWQNFYYAYNNQNWGTAESWLRYVGARPKADQINEASLVVLFMYIPKRIDGKIQYNAQGKMKMVPILREFEVFNAMQLEGKNKAAQKRLEKYTEIKTEGNIVPAFDAAEKLLVATGARVIPNAKKAAYQRWPIDRIEIPPKENFKNASDYYETVFHELVHWTEDKRRLGQREGHTYEFGELVAELGACFLLTELRVPLADKMLTNSCSYLATWLKTMKNDPKYIFDAAAQASKAVDYLLQFRKKVRKAKAA